MRTLIIGDIHGCANEFRELLYSCDITPEDDVILVGDLVNKGPDSAGAVATARQFGAKMVRGNHEARLLALRERARRTPVSAETRAYLESFSPADWAYLESAPLQLILPLKVRLDERTFPSVRVVHAGVDPSRSPLAQDPSVLMNIRTFDDSTPSPRPFGTPWASHYTGPELIVFGHDARRMLQRHPFALGLDTGCCYGGELTGALIQDGELRILSVPARRVYQEF